MKWTLFALLFITAPYDDKPGTNYDQMSLKEKLAYIAHKDKSHAS